MRICELVQTGTKQITNTVMVYDYDQDGNIIGQHEETVTKEEPVMETVYRDMTPEEEAEALAQQAEWEEWERTRPRTPEERCDAVEDKQTATEQDVNMLADTVLALCDIIEGGEQ